MTATAAAVSPLETRCPATVEVVGVGTVACDKVAGHEAVEELGRLHRHYRPGDVALWDGAEALVAAPPGWGTNDPIAKGET